MVKTIEDIRNDFLHIIGEKAEKFGFSRIAGKLEGLLLFSNHPMSLDEMADRLEVSKGSVSTNIRFLERFKVVRKVYNKGDRKNLYEIRGSISEIETEVLSTIAKDEIERTKRIMEKSKADLNVVKGKSAEEKEEIAFIKRRFSEMEEYIESVEYFLNLLLKQGEITPAVVKKISIS
jgi:HTH-type transcriptional regulator, glycine betaine synthesis regulator